MANANRLALRALEMFLQCDAFAEEFTPRTPQEKKMDERDKAAVYEAAEAAVRALKSEPEQPCPYIRGSSEGTHWCALAAQSTDDTALSERLEGKA